LLPDKYTLRAAGLQKNVGRERGGQGYKRRLLGRDGWARRTAKNLKVEVFKIFFRRKASPFIGYAGLNPAYEINVKVKRL
jgi:hypothetical protein